MSEQQLPEQAMGSIHRVVLPDGRVYKVGGPWAVPGGFDDGAVVAQIDELEDTLDVPGLGKTTVTKLEIIGLPNKNKPEGRWMKNAIGPRMEVPFGLLQNTTVETIEAAADLRSTVIESRTDAIKAAEEAAKG